MQLPNTALNFLILFSGQTVSKLQSIWVIRLQIMGAPVFHFSLQQYLHVIKVYLTFYPFSLLLCSLYVVSFYFYCLSYPHEFNPPFKPRPLLSFYLIASATAALQKNGNMSWALSTMLIYLEPPHDGANKRKLQFPFKAIAEEALARKGHVVDDREDSMAAFI